VVTANRVGADVRPDRRIAITGRSQVSSPDGVVLAKAGAWGVRALVADLDLAQARAKKFGKTRNDIFKDRRPEFYGKVTERRR
jgi:predicted amidohydrolase